MSPLLTARPSISVTMRLLVACARHGRRGRVRPARWAATVDRVPPSRRASPLGIICAALVSHLLLRVGEGDRRRPAGLDLGRHDARADRPRADAVRAPEPVPRRRPGRPERRRGRRALPALASRACSPPRAFALAGCASRAPLPAHLRRPGCPPPRLGRRCLHPVRRARVERRVLPHDARARRADRDRAGRRRRPLVAARRRRAVLGRHVRDRDDGPVGARRVRLPRAPRRPSRAPGGRASRCAPASSRSPPWAC